MMQCRLSLDEIIKLPDYSLRLSVAEDLDDENDEENDEDSGNDGDNGGDGGSEPSEADRRLANLESEKQRFYEERQKAREERDAARKELEEFRKNGIQDEQTKQKLADMEAKLEKSDTVIASLSLENAFLKDNTHEWVDPAAALKLADLSQVEISEDGQVSGLKTALDALAKNSPYLLKKSESTPPPRKSGDQPGTDKEKSAQKKRQDRQASLKRKFPALRGH